MTSTNHRFRWLLKVPGSDDMTELCGNQARTHSSEMTVIPIGRIGKITGGEEDGRFVRIKELPDLPPSYLILLARGPDFTDGCGDYWVKDSEDLEGFINEARWKVTWLPIDSQKIE
ncbi:hypothetical protein ACUN3E_04300 [Streptomyces sp. Ju416(a)]|uniref:hypothetical protein n=1 Tax=Streptomyces sp. Ju416(a) TaxID=3446591 RepID=UPI00403E182C